MPIFEDDGVVESSVDRVGWRRFGFSSHVAWVALILVVALATRSFWVAYAPRDASRVPISDPAMYYRLAVGLAQGHGYVSPWTGDATAYYPPGYPMLVGALFRAFGVHISVAWGANVVLGALTYLVVTHQLNMKLVFAFSAIYALNMYFQSYGAV
jgi:hypothetical protein